MKIYINQAGQFYFNRKLIEKLFRVISKVMPRWADKEVSIAFVTNRVIRRLNKTYRQHDHVTDVLSFAESDARVNKNIIAPKYLGEIIIAYPYAKTQAKRKRHSLNKELVVLLTHGFLHLVGYDHLNKKDEQKMSCKEKTILNKIANSI